MRIREIVDATGTRRRGLLEAMGGYGRTQAGEVPAHSFPPYPMTGLRSLLQVVPKARADFNLEGIVSDSEAAFTGARAANLPALGAELGPITLGAELGPITLGNGAQPPPPDIPNDVADELETLIIAMASVAGGVAVAMIAGVIWACCRGRSSSTVSPSASSPGPPETAKPGQPAGGQMPYGTAQQSAAAPGQATPGGAMPNPGGVHPALQAPTPMPANGRLPPMANPQPAGPPLMGPPLSTNYP
eukprot:gene8890-3773_t